MSPHSDAALAGHVNAIYDCAVTHVRGAPIANAFTYPMSLWLVDLDDVPRLPLVRFDPRDHADVRGFLAGHGVTPGRVLMLTAPRVLGYVFNPLTVYWCESGHVVAEVHNTYGGRHCYLLEPDGRGRAETAKEFYVSPFYPVDGSYQMSLPVPGERLTLSVTLHRPGDRPFVASLRGRRVPLTRRAALRAALRPPLLVSARIRRQGIGLYLRGLPVVPRPEGHGPEVSKGR